MEKYKKIITNIAELIETGLISSKDLKKETENLFNFKKEELISKLNLVTREEFEVQKELVNKLQKEINKIKKKKLKR
tara:strand:- start:869 stop:1099 length:231 start_codon:yes stop_codon:yes gene_type:complete